MRPSNINHKMRLAGLLFLLLLALPVSAQSPDSYIWQYPVAVDVAGADDLRGRLETEVQRVVDAGHLAPFRTLYGELDVHFFWYNRFDSVYTLSLAYPHVSPETQARIQTYLQAEMQAYPLWDAALLDAQTGTRREPDILQSQEIGTLRQDYNNRPKLFALYALWLYANNTGDWTYIENNWSSIVSFYNNHRSEAGRFYSSIAGAIGMARMAQQKPTPDTARRDQAANDARNGLNAGTNFGQFAANAENAYRTGSGGWDWMREHMFLGFQFLNLTPELGRYMRENQSLNAQVLSGSDYALARGESIFPLWYMAQAPAWSRYYGEGSGQPVDTKAMIFPLRAWVVGDDAAQLRRYLDVPDAPIGDFYYMQNLARTIEAHGTTCWENTQTAESECGLPTGGNLAPVAEAGADQTLSDSNGDGVEDAVLNGSGTDADGSITRIVWTNNAGQILAEGTFTPTLTLPVGTHVLTLTISDDGGMQDTDTVNIIIAVPTATATATPEMTPTPEITALPTETTVPEITPTFTPPAEITSTPEMTPTSEVPVTATSTPVAGDGPRIEVIVQSATSEGQIDVVFAAFNMVDMYGMEAVCTTDPTQLAGGDITLGEVFPVENSFVVGQGAFQPQDGSWVVAGSRLRPAEALQGDAIAFTLHYTVQPGQTGGTVDCAVRAVDTDGQPLVIDVQGGQAIISPTEPPPAPTLEPTPTLPGTQHISGVVTYQGRADHTGINVALLDSGGNVLTMQVTGADGGFSFTDLPQGDYMIQAAGRHYLQAALLVTLSADMPSVDIGTIMLRAGDTDENQIIDISDAIFVGANYRLESPLAPENADLNTDGRVNVGDLALIGSNFNVTGPVMEGQP